jgi:hypothetical protein
MRELDRERMGLQQQEKRTIIEVKKMAKDGQTGAVQQLAKSIVRNRVAVTKLYQLKAQLQGLSLQMTQTKSQLSMLQAMKGSTRAMVQMNKRLNLPALAKITREFQMQSERMDMAGEMMGDAMDTVFEDGDEEEETDALVNQVDAWQALGASQQLLATACACMRTRSCEVGIFLWDALIPLCLSMLTHSTYLLFVVGIPCMLTARPISCAPPTHPHPHPHPHTHTHTHARFWMRSASTWGRAWPVHQGRR